MVETDEPIHDSALTLSKAKPQLTLYFGLLFLASAFALPNGVAALPLSFFLKERLHSSPESIAWFQLVIGLPVSASILFGFARDRSGHYPETIAGWSATMDGAYHRCAY